MLCVPGLCGGGIALKNTRHQVLKYLGVECSIRIKPVGQQPVPHHLVQAAIRARNTQIPSLLPCVMGMSEIPAVRSFTSSWADLIVIFWLHNPQNFSTLTSGYPRLDPRCQRQSPCMSTTMLVAQGIGMDYTIGVPRLRVGTQACFGKCREDKQAKLVTLGFVVELVLERAHPIERREKCCWHCRHFAM
jgi:hypothetical protein